LMSVSSSSSPRMASCRWRGVIRFTFRSFDALPASSSTSAVRYSATHGRVDVSVSLRCACCSVLSGGLVAEYIRFKPHAPQGGANHHTTAAQPTRTGLTRSHHSLRAGGRRRRSARGIGVEGRGRGAPRMAAEYTAAVAPTRPLVVARDCERERTSGSAELRATWGGRCVGGSG
jgi:hypothetical protein